MNSLKDLSKNNIKPRVPGTLVILLTVDVLIFIVTFFIFKQYLLLWLLINIIIFNLIPLIPIVLLTRRQIGSEEYYLKTVDCLKGAEDKENLVIKMFDIRINNQRNLLFAYLALTVTFALTIAFNDKAYDYFDQSIFGVSGAKIVITMAMIGIFIFIYYTLGIDRLNLKELEALVNVREKLRKQDVSSENKENLPFGGQNMTEKEVIKEELDIRKIILKACIGTFLISVYTIQTSSFNIINLGFFISALVIFIIILAIDIQKLLGKLNRL